MGEREFEREGEFERDETKRIERMCAFFLGWNKRERDCESD